MSALDSTGAAFQPRLLNMASDALLASNGPVGAIATEYTQLVTNDSLLTAANGYVQSYAGNSSRDGYVGTLAAAPASRADDGAGSSQAAAVDKQQVLTSLRALPLTFEANRGQTDAQVQFLARGAGYEVFLTPSEAVLVFSSQNHASAHSSTPATTPTSAVLRMQLLGANPATVSQGLDQLQGKVNYFIGSNPTKWHTNIPTYQRVEYQNIYPGIDLVYYGTGRQQLEYDFVVAPGADPSSIRLQFAGASGLSVDHEGNLVLHTTAGDMLQHAPVLYQELHGTPQPVSGAFRLVGVDQVTFQAGPYDTARPLVIDPTISYSTFVGGANDDLGAAVAVDPSPNPGCRRLDGSQAVCAYVTGETNSADFPTFNPFQPMLGGPPNSYDAFITKLNYDGKSLVYSTYLGGNGGQGLCLYVGCGNEDGRAIALHADSQNLVHAYITGETDSTDFPIAHNIGIPCQSARINQHETPPLEEAFIAIMDPSGSLEYSSYLGQDTVNHVGMPYHCDATNGDQFGYQVGNGIAVDASGNPYVVGFNGKEGTDLGGDPNHERDAFVARIDLATPSNSWIKWDLGGTSGEMSKGIDIGYGIAIDTSNDIYVTGDTNSDNFPTTANAVQPMRPSGESNTALDAFVTKFIPSPINGYDISWSTFLGGTGNDSARAIAVDALHYVYVTGYTTSGDFPTAGNPTPAQPMKGGCPAHCDPSTSDAFVTKLNTDGSSLIYSTYLGGSGSEYGTGIAVVMSFSGGIAFVTGETYSTDFPTVNALVPSGPSGADAYVAKLNAGGSAFLFSSYLGPSTNGNSIGPGIALGPSPYPPAGPDIYLAGATGSAGFPTTPNAFQTGYGGGADDAFVTKISQ